MSRVDFFISNDRHHVAMALPVIKRLTAQGCDCRVLSLCELRGMSTPREAFSGSGAELRRLVPFRLRRSPSVGRQWHAGRAGALRRLARAVSWWTVLGGSLRRLAGGADLVTVPNDAAYPYDRIAALLRQLGRPFLLLQEGIRFPIPAIPLAEEYGLGGAAAIAAWGEASAEHLARLGVPPSRIHLTGSPRFDGFEVRDPAGAAARARDRWGLDDPTLLLVTNPIDDQGFCTTAEKLALVERFAGGIAPLFRDPGLHLAVKLHARESPRQYRPLFAVLPAGRVKILGDAPLEELFAASRAAVVMASTVGLEALLHGLRLAVLEIPGHGYLYDYVDSGAALGLRWDRPLAPQVEELLASAPGADGGRQAYLRRQLTTTTDAADRVASLVLRLLENGHGAAH